MIGTSLQHAQIPAHIKFQPHPPSIFSPNPHKSVSPDPPRMGAGASVRQAPARGAGYA